MNFDLLVILLGVVIGIIDIVPMAKQKINRYYILSAFIFHIILPSMVNNISTEVSWWQSSLIYLVMTTPLAIILLKDSKKDPIIMLVTSTGVGGIVGILIPLI